MNQNNSRELRESNFHSFVSSHLKTRKYIFKRFRLSGNLGIEANYLIIFFHYPTTTETHAHTQTLTAKENEL